MRRTSAWLGCALCVCASVLVCAQDYSEDDEMRQDRVPGDGSEFNPGSDSDAEVTRCNKVAWRIPGQYIVIMHPGTHGSQVQRTIRRLRARAARRGFPLDILQTYSGSLQGFLLKITSDALFLVMKLPHVHYIEEDSSIFAQSVLWNLQSLRSPPKNFSDGSDRALNDGGGAEVYLMDGGVQISHREIEGRVLITDFNNVPEEDGVRVHRQASQCDSHGTHMAGVVSGHDSGVAPGVGVNLVRVLNCQGKGSVSGALAGLQYIGAALQARPVDAVVVLLPFTGGFSRSLNAACAQMVASGAVLITAAGNYRDDACLYSPASEPEVITVGAVTSANQLVSQGAGGTNVGRCVDFFAPGDDIISASSDCSTCFTSRSGTSQAAAHAAGIASVVLTSNQMVSPVQLLHTLLRYSLWNMINVRPLSETHQLTTPNLVTAMPTDINTTPELLCRSVWSRPSGRTSTDSTSSRCRQGEEMMGCSSYAPDGERVGETITESNGQTECVAYNGPAGGGVYAVARCCVISGLQCQVRVGPGPGKDTECVGPQHHLTGCTSWFTSATLSDSHPKHSHHKGCSVKEGVSTRAVCCQAPNLECRTLESQSADQQQVDLSCPHGWTLTDCNAISQGSAIFGPVTKGNSCHIRGADGGDAAVGVIVCCRVTSHEISSPADH